MTKNETNIEALYMLEDYITVMLNIGDDVDLLMHAWWDSGESVSEDQLMNMLIGMKELHNQRYIKLWSQFEQVLKVFHTLNTNTEVVETPEELLLEAEKNEVSDNV